VIAIGLRINEASSAPSVIDISRTISFKAETGPNQGHNVFGSNFLSDVDSCDCACIDTYTCRYIDAFPVHN